MPVRVLIVDDQLLFTEAVEVLLNSDERLHVVGCAHNGLEAVGLVSLIEPDVVLMDITMPVMDGIEATEVIRERRPETKVLILTGSNAPEDVEAARRAGAAGFLTKERLPVLADTIVGLSFTASAGLLASF